MRVVALADLHGHLPPTPACDVLLLAGDLTPASDHAPAFQATWLDTTLRAWLERQPARACAHRRHAPARPAIRLRRPHRAR